MAMTGIYKRTKSDWISSHISGLVEWLRTNCMATTAEIWFQWFSISKKGAQKKLNENAINDQDKFIVSA